MNSSEARIYLDNAATSWPKPESVYAAVENYQRNIGVAAGRGGYRLAEDVGRQIAQDRAERPDDLYDSDLMGKAFNSLSSAEKLELRQELGRMVNQLKTRAALRRKRGQKGKFDAKGTVRASQRYGGTPFELKFKKNRQKPSIVLLLDVSGSLRETVDFALRLIYELQDQV